MSDDYTYKEYVSNQSFYNDYSQYQKKYVDNARESDKAIMDLVAAFATETGQPAPRILDIGCSTGNLLSHLRQRFPEAALAGGDLMKPVVQECQQNERLSGIDFEVMDILDIPLNGYDVVIANAVLYLFPWENVADAAKSLYASLKSGGRFIGFEFMHGYHSDIRIKEKSNLHPQGLTMYFRPYDRVRQVFAQAGFVDIAFLPFAIPIDLPRLVGTEQELISHTVRTEDGQRLLFRGPLAQPWCHMVARKP